MASSSHCWLRFVSVRHLAGDAYLATFEVDGAHSEHEVEVNEVPLAVGTYFTISGTSYFAMMDRGWRDLDEKRQMNAEVVRMATAAIVAPRQR